MTYLAVSTAHACRWFELGFDKWGRTSTSQHTESASTFLRWHIKLTPLSSITQAVYRNIHKNGLFRLETADQTYCEDDKLFLADRFVEGICPNCGYDVRRSSAALYNTLT